MDHLDGISVDHLDLLLLEHWEHDPFFVRLGIRPAKYPRVDTVRRMWGHIKRAGKRSRAEIEQRLVEQASTVKTPATRLPEGAPVVFASHSHAVSDRTFVGRVKSRLAQHGKRTWLSEDEIRVGEPIIDAVRVALNGAAARIFVLTRSSLGSAWGSTELQSKLAKFDCVVWDSTDASLSKLLVSWRAGINQSDSRARRELIDRNSPARKGLINQLDSRALRDLTSDYRVQWDAHAGCRAQPLEASSCAGVGWRRRPDKYRSSALDLLMALSTAKAVLPFDDVREWNASAPPAKFDDVVATLGQATGARHSSRR